MTITSSGWPVAGGAILNGSLSVQQFSSRDGHPDTTQFRNPNLEQSPQPLGSDELHKICKTLLKCT